MILCCGEVLIDMLPRQSSDGETSFAPYSGGAACNTAIALGRLGALAGCYSGISSDMFGTFLIEGLKASNVDVSLVEPSDRPTTLAFVELVDGQASYAFYDENTAGKMIEIADLPDLPENVSTVVCGGISLAVEPCGEAYEALFLREAGNKVTVFDPNIRPGFITDEQAYRARIDRMIDASDIVKMSVEDLDWILGDGNTTLRVRQLIERGVSLVCVTDGEIGATAYNGEREVSVQATPVTVVDTVGAGDTFNAGLLATLQSKGCLSKELIANLSDEVLEEALSLATRSATMSVSRAGANPPWSTEL